MNLKEWKERVASPAFTETIRPLYLDKAQANAPRYVDLLERYENTFGTEGDITLYSAPGRTEIGGNHTDHDNGRVLAAPVNMDIIAAVSPTDDHMIRIRSDERPMIEIDLDDLSIHPSEVNRTHSLIRGMAAKFAEMGAELGGFQAVATSTVLSGSGLSSSAAFEVLIGNILNHLYYGDRADAVQIAQIGQYAENVYFGKPSGLLDQMASSVGNLITIDFKDSDVPVVKKVDVDFEKSGLKLCIINSWASHEDLTDEYAACTVEMHAVAGYFGQKVLRDVDRKDFLQAIPELRKQFGDRAVLRAVHFYQDDARVPKEVQALEAEDFDTFLGLVKDSGRSSWEYLQNIVPTGAKEHQEMAVVLALCDELLQGEGAYRVHGGGFAGTCQAFVPADRIDEFTQTVNRILGGDSCYVLDIRPVGGVVIR